MTDQVLCNVCEFVVAVNGVSRTSDKGERGGASATDPLKS